MLTSRLRKSKIIDTIADGHKIVNHLAKNHVCLVRSEILIPDHNLY